MIGTLEDREAIREVIAAYAHAIDRRRWDMMARLFHDDATFGFGPVEGDWRGFVEQARAIIDPCISTQHLLGQTLIGFADAHTAHCETYLTAMHVVPVGYPRPQVFPARNETYSATIAGRYVDRFERRGGEWRIAKRQGLYDWREFRTIGEASLAGMPEGACGYHDDRDPSTPAAAKWRGVKDLSAVRPEEDRSRRLSDVSKDPRAAVVRDGPSLPLSLASPRTGQFW